MDKTEALAYGVLMRPGPRDNKTDCESDIILVYVPTVEYKRFHGTYYDSEWQPAIDAWITSRKKPEREVTAAQAVEFFSISDHQLSKIRKESVNQ